MIPWELKSRSETRNLARNLEVAPGMLSRGCNDSLDSYLECMSTEALVA
jgi:hypothetical protein